MKQVEITSKVVGRGESEGITSAIPSINLSGFALKSDLLTLEKKFSDFLNVPIIDGTINRWNELETFLAGISEDYNLLSLLNGKADKSYVDTYFVTLGTKQTITGEKNFTGGLKVNGSPIYYDETNKYWKLEGDLLVTGGVTMYGTDEGDLPSILDSLPIASNTALGIASFDSTYFSVDSNGMVTLTSAPSSGASTLGELLNVDTSIDATASVDRILYQPQGSSVWTWRELPKDSVVGDYLPLSGGEINGSLQISNGSLALLGSKNSGASTISFDSNGDSYSSITVSRYGIDYNGVLSICPKGGMVGVGLTNPDHKFHVQGDIYSSGMVLSNSGIEARGTSSYGTLPYIRLHIPGITYAQFLINGNGVVELRYGDNTQTGRFMSFSSGDILSSGGITMYSDQRKKTILNHVELSLKQIADAPLIQHYYNSDQNKTTHVGSIAQYWAGLNDWFCKLDNEGYYTMEIQNCALASAISIARHLERYESKTDKKIRMLKKRITELEDKLERLEGGNYGSN